MARILVVEDELVTAQSIREFLRDSQHTIVANVETGLEALAIAADTQPDLILMDIFLKGETDGITVAAQIYQQLGIPVIYLSASTEDSVLQRAIATKPFGYLVKPFKPAELLTAITIALHRHQLERTLEQAEQWLSTTLSSIGDGTIATDKNGRITFINPVAENLTGWRRSEALGTPASQVLHLLNPETREPLENPLLQAIQQGTRVTLPSYCLLRTKDGSERPIGDSAAPIRNSNGEITGGILVFQDIAERERREDFAYQRIQEFRALVENSPDAIARFDADLRHIYVNPATEGITGIAAAEFINKTIRELGMAEELVQFWEATLLEVLTTDQEQTIEYETLTRNGLRYFQARVVPEFAPDGMVASVLSVARDITDRQQTEKTLQLQAERERLLGAIAQRIRESLELDAILNTAVVEVRQLLQADRVVIYRLQSGQSGFVIVEALVPGWHSMLGQQIADPCLETMNYPGFFSQGHISLQDDIHQADLTDCYIDFLNQFQIQANLVIPIAEGAQLWGLMAIQQCSAPRHWLPWEIEFLSRLATKLSIAIQQSQLYQQTQQLVLREQSLNRVIQAVRHSLDLSTIFQTTTSEIGQLLQVDQVSIIQYQPEQEIWLYLERYCRTPEISPSYVGLEIPDGGNPHAEQLKRFEIVRIDEPGQLEDEFSQILAATFPGSWLFIPLRVHDTLWGAIGLVHHHPPFAWQDWQVELTSTIADQLAIAIQQSELYTEVQRLNASLEAQVLERTALLHLALSFEALLKRITDKVRDSLDENQILQAAVDELGQGLGVFCCGAALYSEDLTTARITHEYVLSLPRAQNLSFKIADEIAYAVYLQLFQAQYTQFCLIVPNPLRPTEENHAILACPIFDDQGVLGDLWLFKSHQDAFGEIEIRLVEQVANQCAIALRQSRLYQAAQAQVTELERLSRLKDDFLSTISHELRTPMSSIKMAIQMLEIILLQNGQSDPPPAKTPEIPSLTSQSSDRVSRYFRILQEECQREIDLIDDMLDLSRLEAETEPLLLSRIEPQIWIDHAVEPFIERIRSQQQRLELDLPAGLPVLVTDLSCLGRILSELLMNACKYTPAGETITVFARATDTGLHIGVANSGIEISAEELPRIFDKFYRVPNHDRWRHGGTGLGLALVKKLVNHLGASIQVESAGGKTTFLLTFPRRDEL